MLLGAAVEDQLGGDLGAGAERAHADIAARKFFGDDAHRLLAEPHAAIGRRNGEAEHAKLGHLRDDRKRNVAVEQMPLVGLRHDLVVGEIAHLLTHGGERLVEAAIADRRLRVAAHQLDQALPARLLA